MKGNTTNKPKVTLDTVRFIDALLDFGVTRQAISDMFRLSRNTVQAIEYREGGYREYPPPIPTTLEIHPLIEPLLERVSRGVSWNGVDYCG